MAVSIGISWSVDGIIIPMLHAWRHPHTGELRLYIRGVSVDAWIAPRTPLPFSPSSALHGRDWVLWVRQGNRMTLEKCPARLEVQSLLRAWLLQRYRRPLFLMSFDQLCDLAREDHSPSYVRRSPSS
jgi:hypothetical protein